jgi:hypothetical protein
MTRLKTLMALLAAAMLVFGMTPAKAWATDGSAVFKYYPNRLSPQYKFTELNRETGACYYRIRFGNFGNVAYAQMRFYNGNCNGTIMRLNAVGSSGSIEVVQNGSTGGQDGCGAYIEAQATSPPGYIGTAMNFTTPYRYRVVYMSGESNWPIDDPVKYCG